MTGSSTQGIKTVLVPVSDLATAKAVYAALLGVPPSPRAASGPMSAEPSPPPRQRGDRFATGTGLDPRAPATAYRWFRSSPRRIQACREVNEPPDRKLMREGHRPFDPSARDAAWRGPRRSTGRSEGEPDVPLEADQIEPGDADGDREGGPAQQMETR